MPKIVKKRLADGTIKTYTYGDEPKARTVGSVIREYQKTGKFRSFAASTKRRLSHDMDLIDKSYSAAGIGSIKRRHALQMMDDLYETPAAANTMLQAWRILMNFAVDREYIEFNPISRIKQLEMGEHRRWADHEIDFAMTALPEPLRRAMVLALWTGQREGDCIAMLWSDYDGQGIKVVQQKTGTKLWLPCPAALKAELDSWPKDAVTILVNAHRKPWKPTSFQSYFGVTVRSHPELSGCRFHGLRKTAAAKLAEAGCTAHEIMSITGHRNLAMVELYTREAGQIGMAKAAVIKLDGIRKKRDTA